MAENKIATPEISVKSALDELRQALEKAQELQIATNAELQAVTGKLLGGVNAFHKDPRKVTTFLSNGFAMLKRDKVLRRYANGIIDFITHEAGVTADEDGYIVTSTKKLDTAQKGLKETSLLDYKSKETEKKAQEKKDQKAAEKQSFTDASAKERTIMFLNTRMADIKSRLEKEDNKEGKKRNEKELQKVREERKYLEQLIAYMDQIK